VAVLGHWRSVLRETRPSNHWTRSSVNTRASHISRRSGKPLPLSGIKLLVPRSLSL